MTDYSTFLSGKVTLVTGGASGIGETCVRHIFQNGGKVAFCDATTRIKEGENLAKELNNSRKSTNSVAEALFMECASVSDPSHVGHVVQATVDKFGQLDFLLNNTTNEQDPELKSIDDSNDEELRAFLDLKVVSCFLFSKNCLPHIRPKKGAIVTISDISSQLGKEGGVLYCTGLAALNGITKALAVDEARYGVRVNSVLTSGATDTPQLRSFIAGVVNKTGAPKGAIEEKLEALHLLNRLGSGEDIAAACLFLLGGTSFITGLEMPVSGGCELGFGPKV